MSSEQDARYELLTQANEDWTGFHEAFVAIRDYLPSLGDSEQLATARRLIQELFRDGLISLVRYRYKSPDNPAFPISPQEADSLLSDPAIWEAPDIEREFVCFVATDAGLQEWNRLSRERHHKRHAEF